MLHIKSDLTDGIIPKKTRKPKADSSNEIYNP